ncbi:hypothetical protein ERO13_D03G089933v2 [Gossypium hirsutum]|uniref:Uncharacterized protein n=1 Tax=Gossypium darwinii TaxID=34276 RepID=A0A5D2D777_GOSDA|nr:hypothetical protein ERO13_D03G089933v2 [Gossypium hirsutum]TYG76482.1 hypothetical protein ES288_D03G117700v1 [Gossypium darwinii]
MNVKNSYLLVLELLRWPAGPFYKGMVVTDQFAGEVAANWSISV